MDAVKPPKNVRVIFKGQKEPIPVDCVYDGYIDGRHVWRIINVKSIDIFRVLIEMLPPHTTIVLGY